MDAEPVAPHGLIGQTFDKDDVAVDGALDDYTGVPTPGGKPGDTYVVTKAMGEGAIEGVAADYEIPLSAPFTVDFKYSRFHAREAAPRNISALQGKRRKVYKAKGVPAYAAIEHDITDAMAADAERSDAAAA